MNEQFTTADVLAAAGMDRSLVINPMIARFISDQLVAKGYSQKMLRIDGKLQRTWSKSWGKNKNRSVKKKPLNNELVQRLGSVLDMLP